MHRAGSWEEEICVKQGRARTRCNPQMCAGAHKYGQWSTSVLAAPDLDGVDALQKTRPFIPEPNTHPGVGESERGGPRGGWDRCRPATRLMLTR